MDKIKHLVLGGALALLLLVLALIARHYAISASVALGSLVLAWGVERYQAIRHEGTASYNDMAASAASGLILAAVLAALGY